MRNGGWPRRYGSAQRQMQARAPRVLCGKAMMGTCARNLWRRTRSHSFYCKYGGARARPHRAVQCTLRRLIEQAGGDADMERHVPELHDWAGVLQQLLIDVSVRCPHAERYNDSASKPGVAAVAGEAGKTKRYGTAVRSLVFETFRRLGGEGTKLLRDLVATAAANSAARMLSDDGGPSWSECC